MLQQEVAVSTFRGKVLWYSPVATTFPITYCSLEIITMTCHYANIFSGKSRYCTAKSILLPGCSCLQAGLNHSVSIGRKNKTLNKVTNNHWEVSLNPTYDCSHSKTTVNKYYNFHVRTYKAQLVGATNIIEQNLTNTPCSATIDNTTIDNNAAIDNMGSHIPQGSRNHIIVWRDPHHKHQWIPSNKMPSGCAKLNSRGLIFSYTPYPLVEPFKRNLGPQGNSTIGKWLSH